MADRPVRKPTGLVEPETVSGEWRQAAFAAQQELHEAERRIRELEGELAQVAERRHDAEEDILRGIEAHVEKLVTAKVNEALSRQSQPQWTVNVHTPPPFQPVALAAPMGHPAPQPALPGLPPMVGAPMAPGLPPMRLPAPSSVTDQDIADAAANAKAERRLKALGILALPIGTAIVAAIGAIASYASAAHAPQYPQPVYAQPAAPPALPQMVHPPQPLAH